MSYRVAAQKYKCSKSLVHYTAKTKLIIDDRKRKPAPWYEKGQVKGAKTKCRKLQQDFSNKSIVQDDEKYFPLSSPHRGWYKTTNLNDNPPESFHPREKFEPK